MKTQTRTRLEPLGPLNLAAASDLASRFDPGCLPERLKAYAESVRCSAKVARDERGRMVAVILYRQVDADIAVDLLVVDEKARRRGYASAVLDGVFWSRANVLTARTVLVDIDEESTEALMFFSGQGFKVVGEEQRGDGKVLKFAKGRTTAAPTGAW